MADCETRTVRIAIQERRPLVRDGLTVLIAAEDDMAVAAAVSSDGELLAACAEGTVDVVLFELDAPEWDAALLVRRLRRQDASRRLVGTYDAGRGQHPVVAPGVEQTVPRQASWETFRDAIRGTPAERAPAPPAADQPRGRLTDRELQVLELIAGGCRSAEIARRLGISPKTVENHRRRIFMKLGVQNQAHAVSVALQHSLLRARGGRPDDE